MIKTPQAAYQSSTAMRIAGTLLLLPILLVLLINLVLPSLLTIRSSFYNVEILSSGADFIGLENYQQLLSDQTFWQASTTFFINSLIQIVIVGLIPLILSLAVQQQSQRIRWALNALFSLPIAFYAPISATLFMYFGYRQLEQSMSLLILNSLLSFGIVASQGLLWYGAIWRASQVTIPQSQIRRTTWLSWLISILLVLGINLQSFPGEYIFNQSVSFGTLYFRYFFMFFQVGFAQALASLLIIALAILGLSATLLIILSNLRIVDLKRNSEVSPSSNNSALKIIGLVVAAAIFLFSLWPALLLFVELPESSGSSSMQAGQGINIVMTVLGAVISMLIQLLLAYLAALAIGALRPLGRYSEWLLLLFAPWLLVGLLPLLGQYFQTTLDLGLLNSWIGFFWPIILNIPLVVLFTLFFKGQAFNEHAGNSFWLRFILPSWPLLLTSAVVLFLAGWRSVIWNFTLGSSSEHWNIQTFQLANSRRTDDPASMAQLAIDHFLKLELPISIIAALCLIPLILKLQGFAIRSGR